MQSVISWSVHTAVSSRDPAGRMHVPRCPWCGCERKLADPQSLWAQKLQYECV